jgi:hypothetical protein
MTDHDPHPVIPGLTAARRQWLYGVVLAAAPLAVIYGLVSNETAAMWVAAAAAFLSAGVALPNVGDR